MSNQVPNNTFGFYEALLTSNLTDGLYVTTTTVIIEPLEMNTTTTIRVPVTKTSVNFGSMTRNEYLYYTHVFTWIKAIGQPISVFFLVVSALVFMKRGMWNSSTGLLVTLNLAEAYNVSLLSIYQICKLADSCFDSEVYTIFRLYSSTFVGIACRRSVYIFNCLVSVQRFLVVAFPMRSKDWTVLHRPKAISAVVLFLMLLANIYIPFKYEVSKGRSTYRIGFSQLSRDNEDIFKAVSTANICITSYLPLLVGIFANIGMGTSLYLHSKSMKEMMDTSDKQVQARRGKKHSQTTLTVLTSTLLFFVFALPSTINHIIMESSPDYGSDSNDRYLYATLSSGFVICQIVSDMVVFFSYLCVGSAFREHLVAMVVGRCRDKPVLRTISSVPSQAS